MAHHPKQLSVWSWGLLLSVWAGALYGVLQVTLIPGNWGHWICGSWGCGPRLQALVACHGFWLVLLLPPAVIVRSCLNPGQRRLAGNVLAGLGLLALLGIFLYQAITWLPMAHYSLRYFLQRILFVIAVSVELPAVEVFLVGLFLRWPKPPTVESAVRTIDEDENRTP